MRTSYCSRFDGLWERGGRSNSAFLSASVTVLPGIRRSARHEAIVLGLEAVAASILTAIYHMLKDGTMHQDLGPNHFHRHDKEQQKKRLVQRPADLGYAVELAPLTASVSP